MNIRIELIFKKMYQQKYLYLFILPGLLSIFCIMISEYQLPKKMMVIGRN